MISPSQRQNARKANDAAQQFAIGHLVALEEHASQDDQREDTHGVEDSGTCALAIGQSDIEERVVQCGVHQGKKQQEQGVANVAPRCRRLIAERTSRQQGDNKNEATRKAKTQACKQHLAGSHILRDAKLCKTQFDEWERPSPAESS